MRFPESLLNELEENFSIDTEAFLAAHQTAAPVSVRMNPLKADLEFDKNDAVPWCVNAFYLPARPLFTNDPLFHAGCYYVQEASSMFVEHAVRQTVDLSKKIIALDACAAPGGKSTLLASLLNNESLLVSNEVISTRVPVLVHNMTKWGHTNNVVSNNDPKDFSRLPARFDLMVVDAPCSGSGLFRKQEDAVDHWSEENVHHCSQRQHRILHDLLPALKDNGVLVYSTCSYSVEEDERICDELMDEYTLESIELKVPAEWGIVQTKSKRGAYAYRFFPHLTKGEGFFLACFRKSATEAVAEVRKPRAKEPSQVKLNKEEEKIIGGFFSSDQFLFSKSDNEIMGWAKEISEEIKTISSALKIKKWPVHLGQIKGKDFIPHPYSAYLSLLGQNISRAEVNKETALKFLRKQNFELPGEKGFALITYRGHGLGWAKNLGNRVNNYYPAEWRILKEEF